MQFLYSVHDISDLSSLIGDFLATAFRWVKEICLLIVNQPLLLVFFAVIISAVAIGYVYRLIKVS